MKRKDRDEDMRERAENYQRGMVRLTNSLRGFRQFTQVDLTRLIDASGRHMGEAPYLKVTAEQLDALTLALKADTFEVEAAESEPCAVLPFARPVLSARRPGLVTS